MTENNLSIGVGNFFFFLSYYMASSVTLSNFVCFLLISSFAPPPYQFGFNYLTIKIDAYNLSQKFSISL